MCCWTDKRKGPSANDAVISLRTAACSTKHKTSSRYIPNWEYAPWFVHISRLRNRRLDFQKSTLSGIRQIKSFSSASTVVFRFCSLRLCILINLLCHQEETLSVLKKKKATSRVTSLDNHKGTNLFCYAFRGLRI